MSFNESSFTFEHVIDVIFEVVDSHGIVKVSGRVTESIFGDDDLRVVEALLDIVEHISQSPRCEFKPIGSSAVIGNII